MPLDPSRPLGTRTLINAVRNGPYWKKAQVPTDPWGNEYRYAAPGQHGAYDLISLGADGKEGGEGPNKDITNW